MDTIARCLFFFWVNRRLNKGTAAKCTQFLWLSAFRTNLTFRCATTTSGGSGVGDCWSQVNSSRRMRMSVWKIGEDSGGIPKRQVSATITSPRNGSFVEGEAN